MHSSNTNTTTHHQEKVKSPNEEKNLHSSNHDTANTQPTEKPEESEAVKLLVKIGARSFVNGLRKKHGTEQANQLLEGWYKKHGSEFVSKAWDIAWDARFQVPGKAPTFLMEDWLSGSRDSPSPLKKLKLKEEEKHLAERRERERVPVLGEGDRFQCYETGQEYVALGNSYVHGPSGPGQLFIAERVKAFKVGTSPDDAIELDANKSRVVERHESNKYIYEGDRFRCTVDGTTYIARGEADKGWISGHLPGLDYRDSRSFRLDKCELVKRHDPNEPAQIETAPPAPIQKPPAREKTRLQANLERIDAMTDDERREHIKWIERKNAEWLAPQPA